MFDPSEAEKIEQFLENKYPGLLETCERFVNQITIRFSDPSDWGLALSIVLDKFCSHGGIERRQEYRAMLQTAARAVGKAAELQK